MPTYAYECAACGHRFEEFQSMTAPVLKKCPACRKAKLQRLIGAGAGVIFKGTGFYQTDYKKTGGARKGDGETGKEALSKETQGKETPGNDAGKPSEPAPTKSESGAGKAAPPTPPKSSSSGEKKA